MKKPIISFIICALIGLGLGYVVFDVIAAPNDQENVASDVEEKESSTDAAKEEETATAGEASIFQTKGCLGCHAVSGLNLTGSATGPDLSQAFNNVKDKHGKPIEEFLKEPTSAVMASVIGGSPLTDEEINEIVGLLEQAASNSH